MRANWLLWEIFDSKTKRKSKIMSKMFVGKFLTVWIRIFQWIARPSLLRSWTSCDLNFNNYLNEETLWNKTKTTKNSMLTLTEIVSVVNHPCRNKWLSHSTVVNTLKERIKKKKKRICLIGNLNWLVIINSIFKSIFCITLKQVANIYMIRKRILQNFLKVKLLYGSLGYD